MTYFCSLIALIGIYSILTLSTNLLIGYGGIVSMAQAGVFGIGAYCVAILTLHGVNFWLAILPAILILGDKILERTSFNIKYPERTHSVSGKVHVDGRVRGYISGQIDAEIHGVVDGDINAVVDVKQIKKLEQEEDEEDDW